MRYLVMVPELRLKPLYVTSISAASDGVAAATTDFFNHLVGDR
jgi:hypothetical protein